MGLSLGYYEAGDLHEAVLQLRSVLRLRPDDPEALIQQGVIHLRWGNLEYAEQSLDQGLAIDPHHPQGWNNLGIVRQRQGNPGRRARLLPARGRELSPTSPPRTRTSASRCARPNASTRRAATSSAPRHCARRARTCT